MLEFLYDHRVNLASIPPLKFPYPIEGKATQSVPPAIIKHFFANSRAITAGKKLWYPANMQIKAFVPGAWNRMKKNCDTRKKGVSHFGRGSNLCSFTLYSPERISISPLTKEEREV